MMRTNTTDVHILSVDEVKAAIIDYIKCNGAPGIDGIVDLNGSISIDVENKTVNDIDDRFNTVVFAGIKVTVKR